MAGVLAALPTAVSPEDFSPTGSLAGSASAVGSPAAVFPATVSSAAVLPAAGFLTAVLLAARSRAGPASAVGSPAAVFPAAVPSAPVLPAPVLPAAGFLAAPLPVAVSPAAACFAAGSSAAAFLAAGSPVTVLPDVLFPAEAPATCALSAAAGAAAVFFALVVPLLAAVLSAIVLTAAVRPADAVFPGAARPVEVPSARGCVLPAVPPASPAEAAAPLDRPVAGCCTAVFFATMAATPSHIVMMHANRAGTINRLESRGNGAHRPIRPPAPPRSGSASVVPSSPPGNPPGPASPEPDARALAIRVSPPAARPPHRPAENRSAAVRTEPYTGRSEKRGWGRVAA
ncbi:hypothetical protein GCM10010503_51100 [Streptomyces lucensis JCM 4490]|uniref:Uncharacterized protein n=1 Tax=Streptomyces lucensis JCM 4490 TaxID=1306176 RepID=A0A918JBD3_9ACTN|nr:hypothetical protein GCM10010503_51100 [Streptomyces lucensis JCM 4490]